MVLYRLPIDKKLIALTANAEDEGVPGRSAAPYTWASAADRGQRLFFLFSSNVTAEGRRMDPYDLNTYKELAIVPLCVGVVLRRFGADNHTVRVVELVLFFVAALANYLTW